MSKSTLPYFVRYMLTFNLIYLDFLHIYIRTLITLEIKKQLISEEDISMTDVTDNNMEEQTLTEHDKCQHNKTKSTAGMCTVN